MLGAQIGVAGEGPTCVGMQEQIEEGVLSWVHMAKGTTRRNRRKGFPSGLEHQGQEDFGFSTESTGNPAGMGLGGVWTALGQVERGYNGSTDVGSGMGVCMSTDGFPVYTVTGTGREGKALGTKLGSEL